MTKTKKSNSGRDSDWGRLRPKSAAAIRKGIAADSDARATDENFWKSAGVVLPAR